MLSKCALSLCKSISLPSSDQTKVMSTSWSCDAAHCIQVSSPTLASALDGAKVIFVDSVRGDKETRTYLVAYNI